VEKIHDLLHLHDLPGSTHGRFRERGDEDPATGAVLNIIEFTRLLIEQILYHNNQQAVDHLLTSEMRQDGVKPTRLEMMKWSARKGYHHQLYAHPDALVTALCPTCNAVVTGRGIYLTGRRYGDHGDEIILERLRYLGDYAIRQHWLERGRHQRFRIQVYFNPNLADSIFYLDERDGLQHFKLVTDDALFRKIVSYQDELSCKTYRLQVVAPIKEEARQARAGLSATRRLDVQQAQLVLRQEIPLKKKRRRPNDAKGRRNNLANETSRTGYFPVPESVSPEADAVDETRVKENAIPLHLNKPESSGADDAIDAWLQQQSSEKSS
jgi:hypothetical protein